MKPIFYFLLLLIPGFCSAITTWQGPSSITIIDWNTSGNWTSGAKPTPSEQVVFNTTVSITQNVPITSGNNVRILSSVTIANGISLSASDVSIDGGSLNVNGSFTINNLTYTNLGGTVTNNQTLSARNLNVGNGSNIGTFNNNGTLSVLMDIVVEEGTFDNNNGGTVTSAGLDVQNGGIVLNGGNFTSSGSSSTTQLNIVDGGFFTNESGGNLTVDFTTSNVYAIKVQGGMTNNGNITVGHTPFNPGAQGILIGSTGDFVHTGLIFFRIDNTKCVFVDNHGMNGSYSNTGHITIVSGMNCLNSLLPIYLSSFKGKAGEGYNKLQWSYENESDLEVCILERSEHGPGDDHWMGVTQFSSSLLSKPVYDYSFKDYSIYPLTYYRLKSVDKNGEMVYSEIISINNKSVSDQVLVYPLPSNHYIHIKGKMPNEIASMHILNTAGNTIKKIEYIPGSFSASGITLDINELSSGVYFLMVTNKYGDKNSLYKFVKSD